MAGKRYAAARALVDAGHVYEPMEALDLVRRANPTTRFDATVEVAFRLGVDPRRADQMVRGTVSLPGGTGKTVRVAVFAEGDAARQAEEAGADIVGGKELIDRIAAGFLDFDAAVALPELMGQVGRLGRVLGPRGLMPNPKAGTVTTDVARAVLDIKAGKVEYRVDRYGNVHLVLGKVSFPTMTLAQNYQAVIEEILRARPSAAKGRYMQAVTISTTMGPGVAVDPMITSGILPEVAASA